MDKLSISLNNWIATYESANERFGFLGEIIEINATDIKLKSDNLISIYPDDFESSLANELEHLVSFAKEYKKHDNKSTGSFLYRILKENNVESTFYNAEIAIVCTCQLWWQTAKEKGRFQNWRSLKTSCAQVCNNTV